MDEIKRFEAYGFLLSLSPDGENISLSYTEAADSLSDEQYNQLVALLKERKQFLLEALKVNARLPQTFQLFADKSGRIVGEKISINKAKLVEENAISTVFMIDGSTVRYIVWGFASNQKVGTYCRLSGTVASMLISDKVEILLSDSEVTV